MKKLKDKMVRHEVNMNKSMLWSSFKVYGVYVNIEQNSDDFVTTFQS